MFFSWLKCVVPSAVLVMLAVTEIASTECVAAPLAHLTINVNYNETGHWLATLSLEKETSLDVTNPRLTSVQLDVNPSSTRCGTVRTDALTVKLQGSPPPPGPGFEEVTGIGHYKVHPELLSWEDAKLVCEAENSYLVIFNSEIEATAIQQLLVQNYNMDWVHVGLHDKIKEGNWVTIFGQPLAATGFSRWDAGQPDNQQNSENCGNIFIPKMSLHDESCTNKNAFVCEAFL